MDLCDWSTCHQKPEAMASMIMAASSKPMTSIVVASSTLPSKPRIPQIPPVSLPKIPTPKFLKSQQIPALKSVSLITLTSLAFAPPSLAAEIEKAALFLWVEQFGMKLPPYSASSSRLDLSYQILNYLSKDAEPRSLRALNEDQTPAAKLRSTCSGKHENLLTPAVNRCSPATLQSTDSKTSLSNPKFVTFQSLVEYCRSNFSGKDQLEPNSTHQWLWVSHWGDLNFWGFFFL